MNQFSFVAYSPANLPTLASGYEQFDTANGMVDANPSFALALAFTAGMNAALGVAAGQGISHGLSPEAVFESCQRVANSVADGRHQQSIPQTRYGAR